MKKLKSIGGKTFIGLLTLTLSYFAIYGFYDHSNQIAHWVFKNNGFLFVILIKFLGIVWSAAFLRIGGDWAINDINPFKQQNNETRISAK
jgi:hypothetical protein